MGKSRTTKKKRIAEMLLEKHPDAFTKNFEENKRIISELLDLPSKQIRNKVAGYLTRVINSKQKNTT